MTRIDPSLPSRDLRSRVRVALEVRSLDRGGLETMVAEIARGLPRYGIDPVVICTRSGGATADRLRNEGFPVEVLSEPGSSEEAARLFRHHRVIALNAHYSSVGTLPAARAGLPVVVTLHNAYAWEGDGIGDEIRRLDPRVSLYIAVSEFVRTFDAKRFSIAPDRIVVVRNRPPLRNVDRSAANRRAIRDRLGVSADAELILHVARVERLKCQLATVAAVTQLAAERPKLHGWIVGAAGEDDYAASVRQAIAGSGLGDRLRMTGERDDVTDLLAIADATVLPSAVEGLSVAALEAVAAGLPSVLTRTGDAEFLLGVASTDDHSPGGGALIEGPWPPPEIAATTPWQDLRSRAADPRSPHAAALARALRAILDDLPARTTLAEARATRLAPDLAPERLVRDYAEILLREAVETRGGNLEIAPEGAQPLGADLERERAAAAVLLDELRAEQRGPSTRAGLLVRTLRKLRRVIRPAASDSER